MSQPTEIKIEPETVALRLKPYRDIVLRLHNILIWKKPYHGPCLFVVVSLIFLTLWLLDLPLLSKLCCIGIVITLLDYFSTILNHVASLPNWSLQEDETFSNLCVQLAQSVSSAVNFYYLFISWKSTNTKFYYTTLLTSLVILAYIGSLFHNLFLLYLVVLMVVLYPGMSRHGIYHKAMVLALNLSPFKSKSPNQTTTAASNKKMKKEK